MSAFPALDDFDTRAIDARWQGVWDELGSWQVANDDPTADNVYVLEMLPYTSGEPHVGHLKNYAVGDAVAHFRRRLGHYVLHPMGFDAFGLPAENHAIRTGQPPRVSTEESIASFREQFKEWGISIDWTREISTHRPEYYRWTQWLFLKLYEAGLAYRKRSAVNWCPKDATVLANEQVVGGRCERCGTLVELRQLEQWFFRITSYAERLLTDLDGLDWPPHVKTMQRNWIGRSQGASVTFRGVEVELELEVFTTRPDTLAGATFLAISPEHPELDRIVAGTPGEQRVHDYVNEARRAGHSARGGERAKTGVPTGRHAVNPLTGAEVPVIVADYVLMEYGTGAIMGVPAHDQRDFEFAEALGLPIVEVVHPAGDERLILPYVGRGVLVNSAEFDGLTSDAAAEAIVARLREQGAGDEVVSYKLRDWLLSRQRYWGCPIPMVYCDACGLVPVPESELPVILPEVADYAPKGESPLATATDWVNVDCPSCGGPGRRETDTMDTFVDSSWYFLRYTDPRNDTAPWSLPAARKWMPVDQYIGGIEHAILHLLYSRFLCKALADLGLLDVQEPFASLFTQGMITRNGAKMSKSRGNVVSPRDIVKRYGADAARSYVLFMGPPEVGADWSDEGVEGVHRFLTRLWRIGARVGTGDLAALPATGDADVDLALQREVHATIKQVTECLGSSFAFNTGIAALMKLYNSTSRAAGEGAGRDPVRFAVGTIASLLFPFAPHVASEVYYQLTGRYVWLEPWPVADEALLRTETVDLVLQVNSKNRGHLTVPSAASASQIETVALAQPAVLSAQESGSVRKVIVVPGRLVNVVVR